MTGPEAKVDQMETNESLEQKLNIINDDVVAINEDPQATANLNNTLNNNTNIQNIFAQTGERKEKKEEEEKEETTETTREGEEEEKEEVEEKKVEETGEEASVEENTAETEDVTEEYEVEVEKDEETQTEEPKNQEAQTQEEKTPAEGDVLIPTLNPEDIPNGFPPKDLKETRNKLRKNSEQLKKIIELPKDIEAKKGEIKGIDGRIAELNKRLRNTTDKKERKTIEDEIQTNGKKKESLQKEIKGLEQQKIDPERIIEKIEQNIKDLNEEYNNSEAEKTSEEITNYIDDTLGTYLKNINEYKENLKKQETVVTKNEVITTKPLQGKNNPKLTLDLFKNIGEIFKSINLVKGDFIGNIGRIWDAFTGETTTQKLKKNQNIEQNDEVIKILSNLVTKKRPDNKEPKLVTQIIKTIESGNPDDIKNLQMKLRTPNNKISITGKIDINTAQILEGYIKDATTEKLNVSIENMDYSCVDGFTENEDTPFNKNADKFGYKMYEKTGGTGRKSYLLVGYKEGKDFIASGISGENYSYKDITVQWSDGTKEVGSFDDGLNLTEGDRISADGEKTTIPESQVNTENNENPTTSTDTGGTTQEVATPATPGASGSTETA